MSRTGGSLPMTGLRRRTKYHAVTMPSTTPATTTPSSFWERMQCCVFGETGDTQLIQATKDDKYEDCKGILERDETIINAQDEATKQTALHYAAKEGKLEYVELFLEYKANCNAQDSSGNTPLHLAIENGHLDCSKKIMECNNLQINLTNEAQDSPLHLAAKKGHMQIVDMLLDTRADYNAPDSLGNTLIHLAAAGSHLNTFGKLHQLNADEINAINNHGNTPLHLAAQEGNSDIIDLLHNYNANCNLKNHLGDTALHLAVTGGHFNCFTKIMEFNNLEIDLSNNDCSTSLHCAAKAGFSEMLGHLLDQGADCNAQDKSGDTSLHLAVTKGHLQCCEKLLLCSSLRVNEKNKAKLSPLHTAAKLGQRNACDLILQHSGADIDIKNKANKTPLHFAAHKNYHEVIELLLDKGANWKLRDKRTYMPLHYAAEKGFENSCEHLMKAFKKDKNSKTLKLNLKDMKTPLMLAAKGGHHRCCKKLPLHDINKQDNYENTALFYAVEGDYQKTVSFLLEKSADTTIKSKAGRTVLHQAAKNKADECLSYLLNEQNTRDLLSAKVEKSGFTPLHEAINSEALTCAKMLLEHNASFTETCKGGMTPLHLAAKQGDPGICSLLMSYDETAVNKENERQETPLHMAAMHGCKDACKVLIQRGTHVLAKDKDGRTALHLAADREHEQVLTLLMRRGASPYIKDDSGATPLHLAASKGHLKCCQILVNNAKRLIQEEDEENKLSIDKAFENKHDDVFAFLIKNLKPKKEIHPPQPLLPGNLSENGARRELFHKYMHQSLRPQKQEDPPRVIAAEAIIESEWWTAACFSETNPVQNGVDQSCSNFRDLINSHPSLALKVQDRCLQYSSAESGLTHDFRLFEDNFCHEEGQITLEKPHALTAGERLLQNHPVSLMVQHTRAELLQHSLTDAWLLHLWRTYVSHIFTFLLIIEVLFLIALHIFIYNVDNWARIQHKCNIDQKQFCGPHAEPNNTSAGTEAAGAGMMFSGGSSRCYMPPSSWVLLTWLLLLVMTSFILFLEGIYLYRIRSEYFRNKRLLRILQVIFTIILLLPLGICEYLHPVLNTWQWHCGLIALLLEWILMIDKLNQLPLLFVFMPITKYFLWTYIKALSYIALLLFVFANIFHLLLSNEPAFRSMPQAMMKMMTWLLGDLNYDDTFVKDDVVHPYMGQPMFGAFIIIMGGFIANLAIRQPSDRVDEFKKCARFFQIAAQSNLFLEIKACFPRVQKLITKYLITNENRKNNFADSMAKRIFKPSIIDEKDESQDTTLESLEEKVHVLINLCMDQKKELKELKQQINLHFKRRPESDPSS